MRSPEKEYELTKLKNVFVIRLDVELKKTIKEAIPVMTLYYSSKFAVEGFTEENFDNIITNLAIS